MCDAPTKCLRCSAISDNDLLRYLGDESFEISKQIELLRGKVQEITQARVNVVWHQQGLMMKAEEELRKKELRKESALLA